MKRKKRKEKDNKKKKETRLEVWALMGVDVDKKEENNNTFGIIFSILSNPLLPHLI